jgi:hypothetical protein
VIYSKSQTAYYLGIYKSGKSGMLAVARNKTILIFEVFPPTELKNSFPKYRKIKEFNYDHPIQFMDIINFNLCIASDYGVTLYNYGNSIGGHETLKATTLLNVSDENHPLYQLLNYRTMDVIHIVDLDPVYPEYLICFSLFGLYICK